MEYLNSITTILVGLFVFVLYSRQKWDEKRSASSIILNEIIQAERKIQNFKKENLINIDVFEPLLLSNNWRNYSHFFANDLDFHEFDMISSFYINCATIDRATEQQLSDIQIKTKILSNQEQLTKIAAEELDTVRFEERIKKFLENTNKCNTIFRPDAATITFQKTLNAVNNISTTPAGVYLKKISKTGWLKSWFVFFGR